MILNNNRLQFDELKADDQPCEVDVADDHDVDMKEREIRRKIAGATYRTFHKHHVVNALVGKAGTLGKNTV